MSNSTEMTLSITKPDGTTVTWESEEIGAVAWEPQEVRPCSNSAYHRMGGPTWWARVGSQFLEIGRVRADQDCPDIDTAEIVGMLGDGSPTTDIVIGYGKRGASDARRWNYRAEVG